MLLLVSSPDAVDPSGGHGAEIARVFAEAAASGTPCAVISNHAEPAWFKSVFPNDKVPFLQSHGRQKGEILTHNAKRFGVEFHDVVVLAMKPEDVQMGKNGRALLIAAGWATDPQVRGLGIDVANPSELREVLQLLDEWTGSWWFEGDAPRYQVRALSDLSSYGRSVTITQQQFSDKVTRTVKAGGPRLKALLAATSRSLLRAGLAEERSLVWGVYPSSSSHNNDTEILSDFTHRLRTTVSKVRLAARGKPLFIRHSPSSKRSAGHPTDRTDPSEQIQTLHLNPYYAESKRLLNKHVVVVDDCTTYGVSFGVAAAFLRKAGAASVLGIALGKFGNQLRYYDIEIFTDPYKPVSSIGYTSKVTSALREATSNYSQGGLIHLIP
jgi:hypothetical protein